jgi:hypothetical protein
MEDKDYQEKLEAVLEAERKPHVENGLIYLSTGVVLGRQPFPRTMLADVMKNFKEPKVPAYMNEEKHREEENPNDPDYIEAVKDYQVQLGMALLDISIAKGSYVHYVPEKIEKQESEDWVEECNELGLLVPKNKKLRYLKWIKYVAAPSEDDIEVLADSLLSMFGVTEKSVETAMDKFPGEAIRTADPQN